MAMAARARVSCAAAAVLVLQACASAPVVVTPPVRGYADTLAAILTLEDERRLAAPPVPAPAPPAPAGRKRAVLVASPPAPPDLLRLLEHDDARVRRRAALAVGRVGLSAGVEPLTARLASDAEPEVRLMAAFALGLIGDDRAAPALITALADADPRIQGRAAEALGALSHKPAATWISAMVTAHLTAGAVRAIDPDETAWPQAPAAEAVRLGVYALVKLDADAVLLGTVADPSSGRPVTEWWPVAYALQRAEFPEAAPLLRLLLTSRGPTTRAFAARGLGLLRDQPSRETLSRLVDDGTQPLGVRVQAIRALGLMGARASQPVLTRLLSAPDASPTLRYEAVEALGRLGDPASVDLLLDTLSDRGPALRAAAVRALAAIDPDTLLSALSGLDGDTHWSVRAAQAGALTALSAERAGPRLLAMLDDPDQRVRPAVLDALVQLRHPEAATHLVSALGTDDPVVRAAAARGLGQLRPAGAAERLRRALVESQRDTTYVARAAILTALAAVDGASARTVLESALQDADWAVRRRAAELLRGLASDVDVSGMRPAPAPTVEALRDVTALVAPAVTPQAYLETDRGTIQIELFVLDAPRTVASFTALVARGYFDGSSWHRVVADFVVQDGDPRGDGEGGPGYTIRDELNDRPYLRGTVGMALDWADTGGSQFFITHSPQPHLDGRYTVFGQVVAGMEVVDRTEPWDVIRRVRIWDGTRWIGAGGAPAPEH